MAKLVSEGRKREFAAFGWDDSQIPNPEDTRRSRKSQLKWSEVHEGIHGEVLQWTRDLIRLRRSCLSLNDGDRGHVHLTFDETERWLRMDRHLVTVLINLGQRVAEFSVGAGAKVALASDPAVTVNAGRATVPRDAVAVVVVNEDA